MDKPLSQKEKNAWLFLIVLCFLVYLCGWNIPLMEIDAAQYANISREMLLQKSFLQVYDRGLDYLDKPPMLFWLSALSMRLFGINDMGYRLPSFLFAILSVYSTFRFSRLFYAERVAWLSALVLASCQAMFLITHDVRTDTMLMGWVIFGIWQMTAWYKNGKWTHLLLASLAWAGGMMTKGPIAVMVPVFAFLPHFLLQRSFKQLFRWEYLVMLALLGVLLIPMSIGLYQQFDLHPEKTLLFGQKGVSGLRFFYWTQSFGRITGESIWHENDSFFFLFENMLWGFLPWIVFFVLALIADLRKLIRTKFRIGPQEEWISTGGFLLTYCALASSRYQLPHYIYVVFPLVAVMTGKWLHSLLYTDMGDRWLKPLFSLQALVLVLLSLALLALMYFPFPTFGKLQLVTAVVLLTLLVLVVIKAWIPLPRLVVMSVLAMLFINLFLDVGFYKHLLQYQMSIRVTSLIKEHGIPKDHFFIYKTDEGRSMDFYNNHSFVHVDHPDSLRHQDYILTTGEGLHLLQDGSFKLVYSGEDFHVSTLNLLFLNPATRSKQTTPFYVLQRL